MPVNMPVCVSCSSFCPAIYKQFGPDIIKLTTCVNCGAVADKYVETEWSIIIIDMLLLRREAIRHVLFNSDLQAAWKFIILFILCDAYVKTSSSDKSTVKEALKHEKYINELELNFYLMCIKSFLEYFMFASLVAVIVYHSQVQNVERFSSKYLFHSIILASYGKLFMLPVLVWSRDDYYCETLIILFIFLSQMQVIRVTTKLSSIVTATLLIIISKIVYMVLQHVL